MKWLKSAPAFPPIFSKVGDARVYFYEDRYFVCSVAGIAETDSITILPEQTGNSELGEATLKHLMEFTPRASGVPDRMTDWRAYQLSGAKSVKTFEPYLWHVDVSIRNGNVDVQARPRLTLKSHLSVRASARCNYPDQVGVAIREAVQGAQMLRDHGLI